jgi:hypothetical protein
VVLCARCEGLCLRKNLEEDIAGILMHYPWSILNKCKILRIFPNPARIRTVSLLNTVYEYQIYADLLACPN